ncbi:excitatory amino acid transporter 3-like [Copidosoma floridanum]|uniref:excitatory amino acid transporter 3-like n=1 Tax=Copidosoma floridanum TaxID=29053 RepID=UPI0006C971F9|nr:excitatory amino acid transporter 3-like [Copidosoma floridanum]
MWRPSATVQILLGISFGVLLGLGLKRWTTQPWNERQLMYLYFPGELFLRVVNCLILPLVVSSIISASAGLGKSGSIGRMALFYYITTTTLGITLCVFLSETIRPGEWGATVANDSNVTNHQPESQVKFVTVDTLLDLMRNLFPENLIQACLSQYQTVLLEPDQSNAPATEPEVSLYEMGISHRYTPGTNVLGLVFFGLVFGLTLGTMPDNNKQPLHDFFQSLAAAVAEMIDYAIRAAPIAVVFLIASKILRSSRDHHHHEQQYEEAALEAQRLGVFVSTVFAGLAIQALVALPLAYLAIAYRSPYRLLAKIGPALATAFGTSSSTATVPTTIRCLDQVGVDPQVSRFVAPIGATINMDGIALYETLGALFIMQMRRVELSIVQTVAISITCTLSCIGAAGMPSGGYAMLIMVLNSLGIPAEDVALIIAVDSFVDRFRTMVNIVADCLGAGIISEVLKRRKLRPSRGTKDYDSVLG